MNQRWQITRVPSYSGQKQLVRSNSFTSALRSPIRSSITSTVVHPQMKNTIINPQFSPMCHQTPQLSPMCTPRSQFSPVCHPSPQFSAICDPSPPFPPMCDPIKQNMSSTSGPKVVGSMGQVWPPVHHPPNSLVSVIRADSMTIEQTAEWVRTLGRYNAWKEVDEYANNFKTNSVSGYQLQKLTNEILKEDLGILKYGHRLKIMLAIKRLFPQSAVTNHLPSRHPMHEHMLQSPMSDSPQETGAVEDLALSFQKMGSTMGYPSKVDLKADQHKKEAMRLSKSPTAAVNSSSHTDLPAKSKSRRKRASPTNPLVYKTLQKARLRSGKSYRAKEIGYLPEGAVVLINQIKGRSGRVVIRKDDGSFEKAGWVCLLSEDKRHLLKKYNPRTK